MSFIQNPDADSGPFLHVLPLRAALKAGQDNLVDLLFVVRAPLSLDDGTRGAPLQSWDAADPLPQDWERHLARESTLALRDVKLSVRLCEGVGAAGIGACCPPDLRWHLGDMPWGAEATVVLRLLVPAGLLPGVGERLAIARARVQADYASDRAMLGLGVHLPFQVLAAHEYDRLPDDARVREALALIPASPGMERPS